MSKDKRITPINRINKFFSEEDFNLEISMAREYVEGDGNFTLILYRVDRQLTESDNVYGEASKNGIRYLPPIELKVFPTMGETENKSYNTNGGLRYLQDGQLSFGIYIEQLEELEVELTYGDYVGYPVTETEIRYFSIVNTGVKNYENKQTIMGYKGATYTVLCAPVDYTEFTSI